MLKGQQTNSNTVNNQYSEQGQQTDLNTVSSQYSERGQQTELSSSDAEILSSSDSEMLTHVAMSGHSVEELSKYIKLLESQNIELLKKQRTNILPGLIGNMAVGAIGGIAGSAVYNLIASNWSTIASALASAAEAIVAAAPVIGIVAGSIAAVGIALFCVYEIYKHREKIKEGAKNIGEKTIEGAKALVKGVKKGYEHSTDSLERGVRKVGSIRSYDSEKHGSFLKNIRELTEVDHERADEIENQLKAEKKDGNSLLIKNILDGIAKVIGDKIADKKKEKGYPSSADELILVSKLELQKEFIEGLKSHKSKILVNGTNTPKDYALMTKTFSEHYGDINEVIKECKKEHTRFNSLERLSKAAKAHGTVKGSSSRQSIASSSGSSIANSTTGSDAGLLDSTQNKKVESTSLFSSLKAKVSSWFRGKDSASYSVAEYEKLSRANSITRSTGSFGSLQDSGRDSPSTDSGDGHATVIRRPRSSSTPSTPVKVSPPVAPSVVPQKPARVPSPSGSVISTRTEVHTHPLANGLDT